MNLEAAKSDPSIPPSSRGLFLASGQPPQAGTSPIAPEHPPPGGRDCSPAPAPGSRPFPLSPSKACGEAERAGSEAGAGQGAGRERGWKRGWKRLPGTAPRRVRVAAAPSPAAALTRQLVVGAVQVAGVGQALLPALAPHLPAPLSGGGNGDGAHGLRRRAGAARGRRLPPPRRSAPLSAAAPRGRRCRELSSPRLGSARQQERAAAPVPAAAGAGHGRPLPLVLPRLFPGTASPAPPPRGN